MNVSVATFDLVVRTYADDLYRYAYWLARDRSDAEDLVQETLGRAWHAWHTLSDEKAVRKWLFTILRREFLRRVQKAEPEFEDFDSLEPLPQIEPAMEDVLSLRRALHQAPLSLRDPLLLQVLGGFTCDEIAQLENTTSAAVMTRLTRARQWFRKFLSVSGEVSEVKP